MNKPKHLTLEYAEQFKDRSVVEAYRYRPPIPDAVYDALLGLIEDTPPRTVRDDAGCGTGPIARRLAPFLDRIDAVDFFFRYDCRREGAAGR